LSDVPPPIDKKICSAVGMIIDETKPRHLVTNLLLRHVDCGIEPNLCVGELAANLSHNMSLPGIMIIVFFNVIG
jgi:hypothetical protein